MANIITESTVIQVQLLDASGRAKSFNIDNPKSNIDLGIIKTAFKPALNAGWWLNDANGLLFSEVKGAVLTNTVKTTLSDNTEISFTPARVVFGSQITTTAVVREVSVEGGTVENASVTWITSSLDSLLPKVTFNSDSVSVSLASISGSVSLGSNNDIGTLHITVSGKTFDLPVRTAS